MKPVNRETMWCRMALGGRLLLEAHTFGKGVHGTQQQPL